MFLRTIRPQNTRFASANIIRTLYTANNTTNSTSQSPFSTSEAQSQTQQTKSASTPRRRWARHVIGNSLTQEMNNETNPSLEIPIQPETPSPTSESMTSKPQKRKRRSLKPLRSPITLTETAMDHLRALNKGPEPKLIRISVRNRGCSGLSYLLEYVDKPEKFDEIIEQGDVKIIIDSKALFSVIGSEMDWVDTQLSSKFVFKNPNSKGTCGCGESFMV